MAAQLIARFFKYFPAYEETAFDSIVDLCESVDVSVRKHATMAMIAICEDCKHLVPKAADILIQLYQTNEASEVNLINQSLTTLLNLDVKKFLQSFFTNFDDGSEIVRERAMKFLSTKLQTVPESALTKDVEEQLLTYSKKAMEDVTKDEFIAFVSILTKLKIAKTATGQAMIVLVIKSQAELDKEFDINDTATLDKFLLCTKYTIPLLSQYNRASQYINFICLKMLPHLSTLAARGNDLNVLQALAEMSPFIHADDIPGLINLEECQLAVFNKLLEYLPLPANESEPIKSDQDEEMKPASQVDAKTEEQNEEVKKSEVENQEKKSQTNNNSTQEADFQFTHIEYLMYTFHQFGRFRPEFFDESRQFKVRQQLIYLNFGCKKYGDILGVQLKGVKRDADLKKEENRLRIVAHKTTKNIMTIIRDLFFRPPQFKSYVLLSCKSSTSVTTTPSSMPASNTALVGSKRRKLAA